MQYGFLLNSNSVLKKYQTNINATLSYNFPKILFQCLGDNEETGESWSHMKCIGMTKDPDENEVWLVNFNSAVGDCSDKIMVQKKKSALKIFLLSTPLT